MAKFYAFVSLLLLTISLFSLLVYNTILNVSSSQPIPPDAIPGKIAFQKQACIECHTVFGNGGYVGGDLTKVYEKSGEAALKEYLVHPPILTGAKQKRHVQVNEQEAEAIVAYLRFLNTIDTLDWPLNPNKRNESVQN
ncbi:c-type cytochrome [Sporomusa sp.]|uniref:c-type cytochrome n=1 Tax=Sporomusa sp. TaxID=2078658 RepID=UPI002CF86CF8|nr:c-type cytochrome [Sporomusa sp.]HWR42954.1 c-type cytochrome [Sporomusa sp.]